MKRLVPLIVIAACSLPLLAGCGTASTGVAPVSRATAKTAPKAKATPTKPAVTTAPTQPGASRPFITQLGAAAPAFSPQGDQLLFEAPQGLMLAQPSGAGARTVTGSRPGDRFPAWSPDGTAIAFMRRNGDRACALMRLHLPTGQVSPLFETPEAIQALAWSPDGRTLAYLAGSGDTVALYRLALPGNTPAKLWQGTSAGGLTITPNQQVIFDMTSDTGARSLATIALAGGSARRLDVAGANPRFPRLSPTGRSLAYVADDGLYVAQANGAASQRIAPGSDLTALAWNPKATQVVVAAPRGSRTDLQVVDLPKR